MMRRALLVTTLTCFLVAGCIYRPTAVSLVRIVDSPSDVRTCLRLDEVSGPVVTGPAFDVPLQAMLAATVALGGTDLYLQRLSADDWAVVRGIAYVCSDIGTRDIGPQGLGIYGSPPAQPPVGAVRR